MLSFHFFLLLTCMIKQTFLGKMEMLEPKLQFRGEMEVNYALSINESGVFWFVLNTKCGLLSFGLVCSINPTILSCALRCDLL